MGYITSLTIEGRSRADGVTVRTVTMQRVANVTDGFVLRETGVADVALAQTFTYRTNESKGNDGKLIRHMQLLADWPYEVSAAPGVVAGKISLSRTGLHVPANAPANVRADVRRQLDQLWVNYAGTVGLALHYDHLLSGVVPF